jgi:DNA-directed RNA polymerase specialized sigma24 family protein
LHVRFEDYVSERGNALLRLAYVLTSDTHLAEDLTQTVLADAYRHWRKVTTARHPDAYVRRMLVNAHLSWHRRRSSTERPSDLTDHEPGTEADPADGVTSRDQF